MAVASALSSLGSVALQAALHPGRAMTTIAVAATATRQPLPLGLAAAAVDVAVSLTTRAMVPATALRLGLLLLLLLLLVGTDTVDMATTSLLARALLVLTLVLLAMVLLLPLVLHQVLVLSSRPTALLVARRHHLRLGQSLLRLLRVMPLLLPRLATCHPHPHLQLRRTASVAAYVAARLSDGISGIGWRSTAHTWWSFEWFVNVMDECS